MKTAKHKREHAVWFPLYKVQKQAEISLAIEVRTVAAFVKSWWLERNVQKASECWYCWSQRWLYGICTIVKTHQTIYLRFTASLFIMLYFAKNVSALIVRHSLLVLRCYKNNCGFGPWILNHYCCCCLVTKSRPVVCDPVACSIAGFPVITRLKLIFINQNRNRYNLVCQWEISFFIPVV